MSDIRTIVEMYVNTAEFKHVSVNGGAFFTPQPMILYRATQVLFECHLLTADPTVYFAPPTGSTWLFGLDNVYTRDHADLVTSANALFVAADWASANFDSGKICWRADLTTEALKTALGDAASATMYCAVWMTPPDVGDKPALMAHWDVTMRNVAIDPA